MLVSTTDVVLNSRITTALGVRAEFTKALNLQALRLYSKITNNVVCDLVKTSKGWITGLLTISSSELKPFLPLSNVITPRLPEYLAQNGTPAHATIEKAIAEALIPYIVSQIMPMGWWMNSAKQYVAITGRRASYMTLCERFAFNISTSKSPKTIVATLTLNRGVLGYRPLLPGSTDTYLNGYGAFLETTAHKATASDYLHVQPLFEDLPEFPIADIPIASSAALLAAIT